MAGRPPVDRAAFRGLPPTERDGKGRVRHPALTDALTELPNRLQFDVVYRLLWEAAGRGLPVTMILFDLPGLGDATEAGQLRLGLRVNAITRQMDMVGRLDRDRIGALFVDCNAFGGMIGAERFQGEIAPILQDLGVGFHAGIAAWKDWMKDPDDLLHAAEQAVEHARRLGAGRIEIHNG